MKLVAVLFSTDARHTIYYVGVFLLLLNVRPEAVVLRRVNGPAEYYYYYYYYYYVLNFNYAFEFGCESWSVV